MKATLSRAGSYWRGNLQTGIKTVGFFQNDRLLEIGKKFNLGKVDDVFAAVGNGALTPQQVIARIKDKYLPKEEQEMPELTQGYQKSSGGIRIKGVGDVMVRLSMCCNPIPGDDIVGYITRGRGISIHRSDCPNVQHYRREEKHRIVEDVSWDTESNVSYRVVVEVEALDRARLTTDIMNVVADTKANINAVNARAVSHNLALIHLKIEVSSIEQMNHILEKIRRVPDVLDVRRVVPKKDH